MKKIIITILLAAIFIGCSDEGSDPYTFSSESTIYSETNTTNFRELVVILKPFKMIEGEKWFVLVDSLYDVEIKINQNNWGAFSSFAIDTSLYPNEVIDEHRYSVSEVQYPIIAPYQTPKDTLTLAGEYADVLNSYFTLEPGVYICEIKSFKLLNENNQAQTIKTTIAVPIEIKDNSLSSLIGEFEVQIY